MQLFINCQPTYIANISQLKSVMNIHNLTMNPALEVTAYIIWNTNLNEHKSQCTISSVLYIAIWHLVCVNLTLHRCQPFSKQ